MTGKAWIKRGLAALVLLAAAAFPAAWLADRNPAWNAPISTVERYSRQSFDRWLAETPENRTGFVNFQAFLAQNGVAGVVEDWQLLRTDINDRLGCPRPAFLLPPRSQWPRILPALRLLRDHVIPAVGTLEVMSSYRTQSFNACVGGAAKSRHLAFSAVDLRTVADLDNRTLFTTLCRLHRRLGPASKFGLGAYFDPQLGGTKRRGRFHVDATGFRSWGYSKKAGSSGCLVL